MLHSKAMCSYNMQNAEYPYDGGKDGGKYVFEWSSLSLSLHPEELLRNQTNFEQTNKQAEELNPNPSSSRSRC
jgi:hypothetical protein